LIEKESLMPTQTLHPTAVIHPTATLAEGVEVGPYAVIGERVFIDRGTKVGPHAVIEAFTTIGRDCQIFPGAVVGGVPQDLKFQGEESYTVIGDRNVVREHVTINRATSAGETTRIGHDNLFMAYVHVAHDCQIGNGIVLANGVTLAGHVIIEDRAIIGGMTGMHQFIRVGQMAMVGAMSRLAQDVPPFMLVEGNPPKVYGLNVVGLRRNGLPPDARAQLKRAFKLIYRSQLNLGQALTEINKLESSFELRHLISFLQTTERGISGLVRQDAGLEAEA
jgi:UDP-N-acetylglucosamine acyltransferase